MNGWLRPAAVVSISSALLAVALPSGAVGDVASPVEWLNRAPDTLVVTDFNGDNKLDMATGGPCEARVFLGNGNATFAASTVVATLVGCHGGSGPLDWGDIDNDGKLDLVWAPGYGPLYVVRGKGDGTFETPVTYTGDMAQEVVAVGDLNGDQRDDVVLADFGGPVSVYVTQVDGTLAAPVTYGSFTAASTGAVAIADFDGNGNSDVAVGNASSTPGAIAVLLGNGDGTLQAAKTTTATSPRRLRAVTGLGADNFDDVVYVEGSMVSNLLTVAQSKGDGTFDPLGSADVGQSIRDFDLLDADHNGILDAAMALNGGNFAVLLNQANGEATVAVLPVPRAASPSFAVFGGPQRIAAGDFNGDGSEDLATVVSTGTPGGGTVGVILSLPSLTVAPNALAFDATQVGASSDAKTITFTAASPRSVAIGTIGVGGANTADFAIASDACSGNTLAYGQNCAVGVRFSPATDGSRAASLVIPSNDAAGTRNVDLSGVANALPTPPPVVRVATDTVAPALVKLSIVRDRLNRVLKRGLRVGLSYSEKATVSLTLTMPAKPARGVHAAARTKQLVVGNATATVIAGKQTTAVVRVAKRVARTLKRKKSVVFTLTLRAKDTAGNTSRPTVRKVTLRS